MPRPLPGEVLVRVRAIGLNFADVVGRWGVYPGTPPPPFVPGIEFSGDVVAVGESVSRFKGRERVLGYSRLGSHAEFVTVRASTAVTMPDEMTYENGAAFLVASMTSYHALVGLAHARAKERVLIHAAAGGVGTVACQLASHLGCTVIGTVGREQKRPVASRYGAGYVVNYRTEDITQRILEITDGYGIDIVLDSIGGSLFRKGWRLLAGMGRYVLFGISAVSGSGGLNRLKAALVLASMRAVAPSALLSANRSLSGFNLGTLMNRDDYLQEAGEAVMRLYKLGVLQPVIGHRFPFQEIATAHRLLQTGETVGKVVVTFE
jgi:alcohol dehydrogenase